MPRPDPEAVAEAVFAALAEPGQRRRIRYRVNAAPMVIAQSYLAALTRDWDSKLARLQRSLDARLPSLRPLLRTWQYRGLDPIAKGGTRCNFGTVP
jgi:hypothetical protein